jgi:transposase InsO family protein
VLGLSERTLRDWEQQEREGARDASSRGRPPTRSSREQRNLAIAVMHLFGPATGVPVLQGIFPKMPRREVEDIVRRYKRLHRRERILKLHILRWLRPGTVWAMDLAEPPSPVDGEHPFLLAVRDLASGVQLAWVAMPNKEAETIVAWLEALVREFGRPMVLKSDNEAVLRSKEIQKSLQRWGVTPLLSPKGVPAYNGSCEAGIGSMKSRTHIEAARHDRAGLWSADDLEAARLQANETARPQGPRGPTPEQSWGARTPIRDEDRDHFGRELERCRHEIREQAGVPIGEDIDAETAARWERNALTRALVACGLLEIRRRRVSLPLKRLFAAKIS